MSFFEFPHTRTYDHDLGWLMKTVKNMSDIMETFVTLNKIKFAEPIDWRINSQYAQNTMVLDTYGNAFLSIKPVPAGIQLSNEDYWMKIFDFINYQETFNKNITFNVETNTIQATSTYNVDDWLLWESVLYKVTQNININDDFIVNTNIVHFTIEDFIKQFIRDVNALILQYKNDIDASELAYKNQLVIDIANITESLQAQLDAAISGVTVDSEVINARIGIDGYTYSTIGEALRTQLEDIQSNLISSLKYYRMRTLFCISSGLWSRNFAPGWCYIMPINGGDIVTVTAKASGCYYTCLKSLANISVTQGTPDYATGFTGNINIPANSTVTFTIPNDANYITWYGNDPNYTDDRFYPSKLIINGVIIKPIQKEIEELTAQVNSYKNVTYNNRNYYSNESFVTGYYVSSITGQEVANSDFDCTTYIPVGIAKKIGVSRGSSQFAFYDTDKNYISGITITDGAHDYTEYSIPATAVYFRLSMWNQVDKSRAYYVLSDGIHYPFDKAIVSTDSSIVPEFTTLRAACAYGISYKNAIIYLKAGVYNLLTEFATEISASTAHQFGCGIGNGIHIKGESGNIISCLYTGNDVNVIANLSPFYALQMNGGYKLENLYIQSSNCRYCVHEEFSGQDFNAPIEYLNCNMSHDDSGAGSLIDYYPQCIGAGTAKHGYTIIEGCRFNNLRAITNRIPLTSWHNANVSGTFSKIFIKNSRYDGKGTVAVAHYGPSTDQSIMNISNCLLGNDPYTWKIGTGPDNWTFNNYLNEIS